MLIYEGGLFMKNNYCIIRISANFHQTALVATDTLNNMIACGFKPWDYKTGFELSYNVSREIAIKLKKLGIDTADIVVKGTGLGREPAIRALMDNGIVINMIKDKTPVPHNGVVPVKKLRKK